MAPKLSLLLTLVGALSVVAAPAPAPNDACQNVYDAVKNNESADDYAVVDAEVAHNCLLSMPFDVQRGVAFVEELKKYFQWHAPLDYLKSPPLGAPLGPPGPFDVMGKLDEISARASKGEFHSQYEFDSELLTLMSNVNNNGFMGTLCSCTMFYFDRQMPLVSISKDGVALPEIYAAGDAALVGQGNVSVSPVIAIDGQPAAAVLEKLSSNAGVPDADARYNAMFQLGYLWPGQAAHKFQFANGTVVERPIKAIVSSEEFPWKDGDAMFKDLCIPPSTPTPTATSTIYGAMTPTPAPTMYPKAEMRHSYNLIAGYYMEEKDVQDVAVLAIPSFQTRGNHSLYTEFSDLATNFVKKARDDGKKKLIIDLSTTNGGFIPQGLDLFRLFFPERPVYNAVRFRAHEAAQLVMKVLATLPDDEAANKEMSFLLQDFTSPNQTYHAKTWEEAYGPEKAFGADMSALWAHDNTTRSSEKWPVRGYGHPLDPPKAPFAAEDMLLMTDGACTSLCVTFVELMRTHGGVRTIAFGGRPQYRAMEVAGGSKGFLLSGRSEFDELFGTTRQLVKDAAQKGKPILTPEETTRLEQLLPAEQSPLLLREVGVILQSNYRQGRDDLLLDSISDKAECRRFYTAENVLSPKSTWLDAARAMWGDGKCAGGLPAPNGPEVVSALEVPR